MRTTSTLAVLTVSLAGASARAELIDTRTIEEQVAVAGDVLVIVDDVFGSIHVTAHDRDTVEMTAIETVRGDLRADIDRARAEVMLRAEQEPGRVAFRVRRVGDDARCGCAQWQDYVVKYDIELKVPRDAALDLATVNDGDITVVGVRGNFDVSNVNGAVELSGLRGTGRAKTVNGKIDARFDAPPVGATSFQTVNGRIEATFPENLAADLELTTMHGELLTDFDVEPIVREPIAKRSQRGGALTVRSQDSAVVRVGAGGPVHSFKTLNGDVVVRKAER